jgi:2-C-methyl-D-erythritol 4-phosphate cytidylyltransferase
MRVCDLNTMLNYKTLTVNEKQLYGVFIDIIPMDGLPDDIEKSKKIYKRQRRARKIYFFLCRKFPKRKRSIFKSILVLIYSFGTTLFNVTGANKRLMKSIDNYAQKYDIADSKFIGVNCTGYGIKEIMAKKSFEGQVKVKFEDDLFTAPENYEQYLKSLYGNYMKLPPLGKRTIRHKFEVFRKEGSMNIALIFVERELGNIHHIPNPFQLIEEKPLIIYTMQEFQSHPGIDAIMVVCQDEWCGFVKSYAKMHGVSKLKWVIPGRDNTHQSIYDGLMSLRGICDDNDMLLIHDGVRPLVSREVISACIAQATIYGNAVSAINCDGDIFLPEDNACSLGNHKGGSLIQTQTPQGFGYKCLLSAYEKAHSLNIDNTSSTCELMCRVGEKIYYSKGTGRNIRINTADDLKMFRLIARTDAPPPCNTLDDVNY